MPKVDLSTYKTDGFFDEMLDKNNNIRPQYALFQERLMKMGWKKLNFLQHSTDKAQLSLGMTFNVYNDQKVLKDKIIPKELIYSSSTFLKQCIGLKPPENVWSNISGSDLIQGDDGGYMVLEDNLRVPSGVSYMLENREILKRTFPELFEKLRVRPVYDYSHNLRDMYRKSYGKLTTTGIAEFLVLDKMFPRSVLRCLIQAEQSMQSLTGSPTGYSNTAERQLGLLKSQLEYADINEIFNSGLHEYLDNLQEKLNDISAEIYKSFFAIENKINLPGN